MGIGIDTGFIFMVCLFTFTNLTTNQVENQDNVIVIYVSFKKSRYICVLQQQQKGNVMVVHLSQVFYN